MPYKSKAKRLAVSREQNRKYRLKHPEKERAKWRKDSANRRFRKYGLNKEKYLKILASQNYVCAICSRPETCLFKGKVKTLSIDHDHKTGRVRGLLCSKCNSGLGYYEDSVDRLRNAALYLENV